MSKKICIFTMGSRGDVEPYLALASALQQMNFQISFSAPKNFQSLAFEYNIPFLPFDLDTESMITTQNGSSLIKMNLSTIKTLWKSIVSQMQNSWDQCLQYAKEAHLLICHPKILVAYDLAESLNIPLILAHPTPLIAPIKEFPFILFPNTHIGSLNQYSYRFFNSLLVYPFLKKINQWRKNVLHLPKRTQAFPLKLHNHPIPILYGFSQYLFPQVTAWPSFTYITGAWVLPKPSYQLPPEIQSFIQAGSPPICVTFSSMPLQNPHNFLTYLQQALNYLNIRAIFIKGWSKVAASSTKNLLIVDYIPHQAIFPHAAGVIHHGGAGTTTAALTAGKPMIICPFTGDQPFWAKQMLNLHVCAAILPEKKIHLKSLIKAIQLMINKKSYSQNAQKLSRLLQQENGLHSACHTIKTILETTF